MTDSKPTLLEDDSGSEFHTDGPSLGADGSIQGKHVQQSRTRHPMDNGLLQLNERPLPVSASLTSLTLKAPEVPPPAPPPPERSKYEAPVYRDVSDKKPSRARPFFAVLAVGLVGGALVLAYAVLSGRASQWIAGDNALHVDGTGTGSASAPLLEVFSEPSGADVRIGEDSLGTTPFIGDNHFPKGHTLEVTLVRKGFQPAHATFQGGEKQTLHVRLHAR